MLDLLPTREIYIFLIDLIHCLSQFQEKKVKSCAYEMRDTFIMISSIYA